MRVGLIALVLLVSCGAQPAASVPLTAQPGYISQTMLGDAWPLTLTAGRLECGQARAIVFYAEDGTGYAVNLPAKGQAADRKLKLIEAIAIPGAKFDALIDAGLKACRS